MRRHFHLKTRRLTAAAAAAALSLGSLGVAPAFGAFTFTKIVDSNTADPGGAGTINSFSPPALDGNTVAFRAFNSHGQAVFEKAGAGPLTTVADTASTIPSGSGKFVGFNNPSVSGANITFWGTDNNTQQGIYATLGGPLTRIVDRTMAMPSSPASLTFSTIQQLPSISGSNIVFSAMDSNSYQAVFSSQAGGAPVSMVGSDPNFPTPFTSTERGVANPVVVGNAAVFVHSTLGGTNIQKGTVGAGGAANQVGGAGAGFGAPGYDYDGTVIGYEMDTANTSRGVFAYNTVTQQISLIADNTTLVPGGGGAHFVFGPTTAFNPVSVSNGAVTFVAGDSGGGAGVYTTLGGSLQKVIRVGDVLDGEAVSSFSDFLQRDSMSGDSIALEVFFGVNPVGDAIYVATAVPVPEPTSIASACGVSAVLLLRRRRARVER